MESKWKEACPCDIHSAPRHLRLHMTPVLSGCETTGFLPAKRSSCGHAEVLTPPTPKSLLHWRWLCALCWYAALWFHPVPLQRRSSASSMAPPSTAVSLFWLSQAGFMFTIVSGCLLLNHCEVVRLFVFMWFETFYAKFCLNSFPSFGEKIHLGVASTTQDRQCFPCLSFPSYYTDSKSSLKKKGRTKMQWFCVVDFKKKKKFDKFLTKAFYRGAVDTIIFISHLVSE